MAELKDSFPTVLLPENDPVISDLKEKLESTPNYHEELGAYVQFTPMTLDEAAAVLREGKVDIVIGGLVEDSADVLRTAIKQVNRVVAPDKRETITSFFAMEKEGQDPIFLADCAVHEKPDTDTIVTIAEHTAQSVKDLGFEPVVAFLSLSSFGSASHLESVQNVKDAADKFKAAHPDIISYGEIQADAALNSRIFQKKANKAGVELVDGKMPNVFVFPDGTSGNLAYKFLEQLAGHVAVGPMLNGVELDFHDLSRGATVEALEKSIRYAALLHKARKSRA